MIFRAQRPSSGEGKMIVTKNDGTVPTYNFTGNKLD